MRNIRSTVLLSLALISSGALAQGVHGSHGTSKPASSMTAHTAPNLSKLQGKDFDRAYLSMMIGHHQGALDMSKAVTSRLRDQQVKGWAQAVIADQTREINTMTGWLKTLGGLDKRAQDHMAGEMRAMTAPLRTATNPDRAFVSGMLPHHASALEMANLALQRSSDERVLKLSRDIVKAQADEMYAFKVWLSKSGR